MLKHLQYINKKCFQAFCPHVFEKYRDRRCIFHDRNEQRMNDHFFSFKIVPLAFKTLIPMSFPLVEAPKKKIWLYFFSVIIYSWLCRWGWEYSDCIHSRRVRHPPKKGCGYYTKMHLVVKVNFCRFEKPGLLFHCHYSQIHSEPEW